MTHSSSNHEIKYASKISPNFTLLEPYITMHINTLIRCNRCLHEWSPAPTNFLRRIRCVNCENKTKKKSPVIVENLKTPTIVYILLITNTINNFKFIKVGVTTKDIVKRVNCIKSGLGRIYLVEVVDKAIFNYDKALRVERNMLDNLRPEFKYTHIKGFGGHTELLTIEALEWAKEILQHVKDFR